MSIGERFKQVLDALAYFGGLATGISIIAMVIFCIVAYFANRTDAFDLYEKMDEEEIDERTS